MAKFGGELLKRPLGNLRTRNSWFSNSPRGSIIESAGFRCIASLICELHFVLKVGGDPASGWGCIWFQNL